jgi:hypothetical protein
MPQLIVRNRIAETVTRRLDEIGARGATVADLDVLRAAVAERDAQLAFIAGQLERARADVREIASQAAADQGWIHDLLDQVQRMQTERVGAHELSAATFRFGSSPPPVS